MRGSIYWPRHLLEKEDLFKRFPNLEKLFIDTTFNMSSSRTLSIFTTYDRFLIILMKFLIQLGDLSEVVLGQFNIMIELLLLIIIVIS
jgi:hypothetical protein